MKTGFSLCGNTTQGIPCTGPVSNQVRVVAFSLPQLTQASFIQKNQTLQNRFLISVTLRWHRVSVACKNQSLKVDYFGFSCKKIE